MLKKIIVNKTIKIRKKFHIKVNLVNFLLKLINLDNLGYFSSNLKFLINIYPNKILIIVIRVNNINREPLICIIALISIKLILSKNFPLNIFCILYKLKLKFYRKLFVLLLLTPPGLYFAIYFF